MTSESSPDLRGLDPLSRRDFMRAFVEPPNP